MLNAIFRSMNTWAIVELQVRLIVSIKPFTTLERWRSVGRVTVITVNWSCCFIKEEIDFFEKKVSYRNVFTWMGTCKHCRWRQRCENREEKKHEKDVRLNGEKSLMSEWEHFEIIISTTWRPLVHSWRISTSLRESFHCSKFSDFHGNSNLFTFVESMIHLCFWRYLPERKMAKRMPVDKMMFLIARYLVNFSLIVDCLAIF